MEHHEDPESSTEQNPESSGWEDPESSTEQNPESSTEQNPESSGSEVGKTGGEDDGWDNDAMQRWEAAEDRLMSDNISALRQEQDILRAQGNAEGVQELEDSISRFPVQDESRTESSTEQNPESSGSEVGKTGGEDDGWDGYSIVAPYESERIERDAPVNLDDDFFLSRDFGEEEERKKRSYVVSQPGGLELVALQVEGDVGESDVGADPNATRTYSFWMPKTDLFLDPANPEKGTKTWEQVLSEHGLPEAWGFRTRIVYANIPQGTAFECEIGVSKPIDAETADGDIEQTVGGGIELHFEGTAFDPSWKVFDVEDEQRGNEAVSRTEGRGPFAMMDVIGNSAMRDGQPVDRRYRDEVPVYDPETGKPMKGSDGKYLWARHIDDDLSGQ